MRLFLNVSGIGDREVVAGALSTAGDLAAALVVDPDSHPDQPDPGTPLSVRVARSGAVLAPDQLLSRLDLRSGDRVEVVGVEPEARLDAGPDPSVQPWATLRMLTGPLAGGEFRLPAGTNTVGRAASNDLALSDPGISRHHATIAVDAAAVVVTDLGSTNGIRIEGEPIDGPTAIRSGQRLLLGQSWASVEHFGVPVVPAGGRVTFERPQRLVSHYEGRRFTVTAPAEEPEARPGRRGLAARLQSRQADRAYDGAIEAVVADLTLARREERKARSGEHPSIDDVLLAVRSQTRLWERRLTDPDVLQVRLGLAELPSRQRIEVGPGGPEAFRSRAERLPRTYALIDGVPATFDLGRPGGLTLRGGRDRTLPLAAALVGQLVGLNPPDQLGVVLCGDRTESWDWLKWLPHAEPVGETGPPTGQAAADLVRRLLDADPEQATEPTRPPFVVVVIDASPGPGPGPDGDGAGEGGIDPALVDRLLTAGAQRGVHPLLIEEAPAGGPGDGGAVLTITGATAQLSVPDGPGNDLDPIATEGLAADAAVELGRLLAPLRMGPVADPTTGPPGPNGAVAVAGAEVPGGTSFVSARPLTLTAPDDVGPVDLFDLPRSKGDSRLVLGKVVMDDDVETVLAFNPPRDGTLALVGPPGSERSGCVSTVAASAARLGVPADQRPLIYAFGDGPSLDGLEPLPAVTGLVGGDPGQAIELLAAIEQRMDDRLLTFELAGVDDLNGFRQARPGVVLRRILVLIDGLGRLTSLLEPDHPGRTREVVGQLLEIGSALGLHLVFTVEDRNVVDPLLAPKVGRWLEIDGSVDRPGRVRLDGAAVRFAVPGGSWHPGDIDQAIAGLAAAVDEELAALDGPPAPSPAAPSPSAEVTALPSVEVGSAERD